jgi:hypothetical protein
MPTMDKTLSQCNFGWAQTMTTNLAMRRSCFLKANCAKPMKYLTTNTKTAYLNHLDGMPLLHKFVFTLPDID